jgi:hypothetical protein
MMDIIQKLDHWMYEEFEFLIRNISVYLIFIGIIVTCVYG